MIVIKRRRCAKNKIKELRMHKFLSSQIIYELSLVPSEFAHSGHSNNLSAYPKLYLPQTLDPSPISWTKNFLY